MAAINNTRKTKTLSEYSDEELVSELSKRGYTVVKEINPPEFVNIEWPITKLPEFEI